MATPAYQIPAPEVFSFQSEDWSKWIARFEKFRTASGLMNKPKAEQVNSLLYLMGSQSEEIFRTFNLKQTGVDSYEVVKAKFERYFIPTRNVIDDRYKFNMRIEEEDEAVEDFITVLHNLAQNCKFPPSFGDEAIRDSLRLTR
ncbi:hypothetical protein AVEN_152807-1 [Araneus ventricosus]|uniref:Retrotransposon gag domain-containing protein n=1 Tax=Araneus ventricosus TaxID=182803 RepID=A0A4Y2LIY5_ARAVE|nr:hypothetical protein AVEN_152807-1 [Araneus ventricosus]